jgi:hypothetical protein
VVLEVKHNWGLWLAWARSPAGKLALFVPPLALLMLAESRTWRRARPVLKRQPA